MFFPWVGLLEQVRLADIFVHYDDVQFSKGSFVNRVQIKTPQGMRWMTIPLVDVHLGQRIKDVKVAPPIQWRDAHLRLLKSSFSGAPFEGDALQLAECVFSSGCRNLGELVRRSVLALVNYFGLDKTTRFVDVESLDCPGVSSERVLSVVQKVQGDVYVTGHGAARYLDHESFDAAGIRVEYINYQCRPYPQLHGEFVPFVSGLDLVANCGKSGVEYICSDTVFWREIRNEPN